MSSTAPIQLAVDSTAATVIETRSHSAVDEVETLEVTSATAYEAAGELGKSLSQLVKEVDATFDPIISSWNKGHKQALETKAKFAKPLEQAIEKLKAKMIGWKRAEKERVERENEQKRRDAERLEEDRRLNQAAKLEDRGNTAAAMRVLEQPPAVVHMPPVAAAAPKVAGVVSRKTFKCDRSRVDVVALAAFVVKNPSFANLLLVDWKHADNLARMQGAKFDIPGLCAFEDEGLAFGGRK